MEYDEKGGYNYQERNYQCLTDYSIATHIDGLQSAMKSQEVLSKAPMITIIGDRESDIYE